MSVVIKVITVAARSKFPLNWEISALEEMRGCPESCQLLDVVLDADSRSYGLILTFHVNDPRIVFRGQLSRLQMATYMRDVLRALSHAHARHYFHRDVAPKNVMFDPSAPRAVLVDWGFARRFEPGQVSTRAKGTPRYLSPEQLFGNGSYCMYGVGVDIWAAGVCFAEVVCGVDGFFRTSEWALVVEISTLVPGMRELARKLGVWETLPEEVKTALARRPMLFREWIGHRADIALHHPDADAWDVVWSMLQPDPERRPTADDLLAHPFLQVGA